VPYDTDGKFAQSYFGTLRARLGWSSALMGSPTLWYLTGGFAFSDGTRQIRNTRYPDWSSASEAQAGWVFGGGVEHKFTSHWSFKAELLYADLGKAPYQDPNATVVTQVHLTDTLLRLGLNYKF
jgi:outer membrane immunogenic protein